jgi:DNA-binding XRE family transcriptional regulator
VARPTAAETRVNPPTDFLKSGACRSVGGVGPSSGALTHTTTDTLPGHYTVWTLKCSAANMACMVIKHPLLKALGERIRERRQALGVSQEALARGCGLHRNVVGRLERGIYNPSVLTLYSIAAEFDVPLSGLFKSVERRST